MKILFLIIFSFYGFQSLALTSEEASQIASQFSQGNSELARLQSIISDAGYGEYAAEMSEFRRVPTGGGFLPACHSSGYCRSQRYQTALTNSSGSVSCLITTTVSGRRNVQEERTTSHSVACR